MHDPLETANIVQAYFEQPEDALALVTLVEKTGSSYRQPGARMLVKTDRSTIGTISGGCLESDLADLAVEMEREGKRTALEVIDTRPIFGCQGTITLFMELISPERGSLGEMMQALHSAFGSRHPITLKTTYSGETPLGTVVLGNEQTSTTETCHTLVQRFGRKKRLVLIGAHNDVESVLNGAKLLGWECIQIMPGAQRTGWAASDPAVKVMQLDATHLLSKIEADDATAVVIMTHNLGRDISYATALLQEKFAYIGMLGSSKRRQELMNHLMELGDEPLILATEKLHCPIGLNIGSETQTEIALSILSEIQAVFAGRDGTKLTHLDIPIHPQT